MAQAILISFGHLEAHTDIFVSKEANAQFRLVEWTTQLTNALLIFIIYCLVLRIPLFSFASFNVSLIIINDAALIYQFCILPVCFDELNVSFMHGFMDC